MNMEFKIHDFEGPLDLLLHLIKESKMDIMDIQIEDITEQYVAFIRSQQKLNLDVSSEYLVMAAELIEIKYEEEEDPREELVNRLLEYQAYKDITKLLQEKELLRREIYTKSPENIQNYQEEKTEIHSDVSLDDLVNALLKYYERKRDSKPLNTKVTIKEISVSSRRHDIKYILKEKKKISFFELFPIASKEYIVATFLAVLEMAKDKELRIVQNKAFDDITCEVVEDE